MKLIELHILQSFPVSCLNRDDVGAPKTATFGGVTRARISSQCLKRAIRLYARELENNLDDKLFAGSRTRKAVDDLRERLSKPLEEWNLSSLSPEKSGEVAKAVCHGFLSSKKQPKEKTPAKAKKDKQAGTASAAEELAEETSTLLYFSPGEIDLIARAILEKPAAADLSAVAVQALKDPNAVRARDLADIAIFGRMVSNAPDLTLEGAGLFNHALTTHRADNDLDFWTAVDDNKEPGEDAGAANMNVSEFTSGVFYRYAALNLDLLFDPKRGHLRHIAEAEVRQRLVSTFLQSTLRAIPSARDNSHNSHTEIGYALGFCRTHGQPLQLINAFEDPVHAHNGLLGPSVRKMLLHLQRIREDYGDLVQPALELAFGSFRPLADPEDQEGERLALVPERANLGDFCGRLAQTATTEGHS
jgi:CRISPR system Cascade subunit CasC